MKNFRTLDLNLLRVFDAVMTEGSVTRAAEVLAMTQPAASHALKRLNAWLGEPLFQRSAAGMTPGQPVYVVLELGGDAARASSFEFSFL